MFAEEGVCQSSPNRVARGSWREHEKGHLSGLKGVLNSVNNRNFKSHRTHVILRLLGDQK